MEDSDIDDLDECERRLIAKGIIIPPKTHRPEGYKLPRPTGRMISQEVMDQIWEEERADRC
ncbi:MAG: hypothetical protein ABSC48_18080 [Terracidiphilus sp.]|jgi:hypothetical protein